MIPINKCTGSCPQPFRNDFRLDPVFEEIMEDPVMCRSGHTFDRSTLNVWIATCKANGRDDKVIPCPVYRENIRVDEVFPNLLVKEAIEQYQLAKHAIEECQSAMQKSDNTELQTRFNQLETKNHELKEEVKRYVTQERVLLKFNRQYKDEVESLQDKVNAAAEDKKLAEEQIALPKNEAAVDKKPAEEKDKRMQIENAPWKIVNLVGGGVTLVGLGCVGLYYQLPNPNPKVVKDGVDMAMSLGMYGLQKLIVTTTA